MLAIKRLICEIHCDEAPTQGIKMAFKTRSDCHQKPTTILRVASEMDALQIFKKDICQRSPNHFLMDTCVNCE